MGVLCPHYEYVGSVRLEVGHCVRHGVDPDGGHHTAGLEVAAVVLDGVTYQGGGALGLVLPPGQSHGGRLSVHHLDAVGRGGEGGRVGCPVEDDVRVLGILHSDVGGPGGLPTLGAGGAGVEPCV